MKIGWREWAGLPDLGINTIKLKVDTGAKTSALHARKIELFNRGRADWVRFCYQPEPHGSKQWCEAAVIDQRHVTNSGGVSELRYVIKTSVVIGSRRWPIELTLTNRKQMKFKMILGRQGMKKITVKPHKSFLQHKPNTNKKT